MRRKTIGIAVVTALLCGGALAENPEPETGEDIRACVRRNAPDTTSTQAIELSSVDRAGGERKLSAELYWKKHDDDRVRLMIRVLEPFDLKGSSYLVIENEPQDSVYAYLPALGRSRRIAGGGAREIWSTDFAYQDIRLLQMKSDRPITRLDDAEIDGKLVYVVEQVPDPERESGYERVVSYVDPDNCVVLRTEYFEPGDKLRKRLACAADGIRLVGQKWVAHKLEMTDLRDETQSWITVSQIAFDEKLSNRFFSIGQYYR